MLISEVMGWHYVISWDNPLPADSSAIRAALVKLGKVTDLATKTSVALAPKGRVTWHDVRSAIANNLDQTKGKAFYCNLRTAKSFQIDMRSGGRWKHAAGAR